MCTPLATITIGLPVAYDFLEHAISNSRPLLFAEKVSPILTIKGASHLPFSISTSLPAGYNVILPVFGETPASWRRVRPRFSE
jgi:hypothetical protein